MPAKANTASGSTISGGFVSHGKMGMPTASRSWIPIRGRHGCEKTVPSPFRWVLYEELIKPLELSLNRPKSLEQTKAGGATRLQADDRTEMQIHL